MEDLVGGTLQSQSPDVHRFVPSCFRKLDGLWRDTGVGQKPHSFQARIGWTSSWARAAAYTRPGGHLLFEVREFLDDLRRRHAVGDEVDDMSDGDP